MRRFQGTMLALAGTAAAVSGGVAVNQILDGGKLSFTWAYLAFGFTLFGALVAAYTSQPSSPSGERMPWRPHIAYRRQLRSSVARMETLGIITTSPYVLRSQQVYVDLALRTSPLQDAAGDAAVVDTPRVADQPEGLYRAALPRFLAISQILAVIGSPGSGKTTLIRHQALAICDERWRPWKRRELPILLYLRDHTTELLHESQPELPTVAATAPWLRGRIPDWWLKRQLDRRRCIIMLDGLDEVAAEQDRQRIVTWVKAQIERYPKHKFIITSRPHGYLRNPLPSAEVLRVQRFRPEQIARFLDLWYNAVEYRARHDPEVGSRPPESIKDIEAAAKEKAYDLFSRLRRQPALFELAANPLLLTMIANVHRYRGALPGSRAALYGEMCEVLLQRRLDARSLADLTGLTGPQKSVLMQHLAYRMMVSEIRDISASEASAALSEPLESVHAESDLTPAVLLTEICKSGLLAEREQGTYAFAHLTLQEYLAAAHIQRTPGSLNYLIGNVDNAWWRETMLLWSSNNDATLLINTCLASGTIPALTLAFECADQASQVQPAVLAELDKVLNPSDTPGPLRQRLIDAISASRALHEILNLNDGTAVCAQPVTRDLWNRFVQYELRDGRQMALEPTGKRPVTDVGAEDAERFVVWLNSLFDDVSYRFPEEEELSNPDVTALPAVTSHSIWIRRDGVLELRKPTNSSHPYQPSAEQITLFPRIITGYAYPLLERIVFPDSTITPVNLLAYAFNFSSMQPNSPETKLIRLIDTAAEYEAALFLESDEQGRNSAAYNACIERARLLDLSLGDNRRDRPREIAGRRETREVLCDVLFEAFNIARHLDHTTKLKRILEDAFGEAVDYTITRREFLNLHLKEAFNLSVDYVFDRGPPDSAGLAVIRERTRSLQHTINRLPASTWMNNLTRFSSYIVADPQDVEIVRLLTYSESLGDEWRRISADAPSIPEGLLAIVLARARLLGRSYGDSLPEIMSVLGGLFHSWNPSGTGRRRSRNTASPNSFESYLSAALRKSIAGTPSDQPLRDLDEALRQMPARADSYAVDLAWTAKRLLAPIIDHKTLMTKHDFVMATAGVLAALNRYHRSGGHFEERRLASALTSLVGLVGPRTSNETILLIRG